MSAIKDGRLPIELNGKEYHLLFSLNVIDDMQDRFGGFDTLGEVLQGQDAIKNLRWLLTMVLNEGAEDGEPELSEKEVGKLIHMGNFDEVKTAIFKAFSVGSNSDIEPDADDEEDETADGTEYETTTDDEEDETEKNAVADKE
jgi:hypothetical protein